MFARRQRRQRCATAGRPARVGWHRLTSAHGREAISAVPAGDVRRAVQCDAAGLGVAACVRHVGLIPGCTRMHASLGTLLRGKARKRCSAAQRKAKRRHFVLCELSRLSLELNATHIHIFESVYKRTRNITVRLWVWPLARPACDADAGAGECAVLSASGDWAVLGRPLVGSKIKICTLRAI